LSLRVFPVVEGHGEEQAIRLLLTRIWTELLQVPYLEVLKPMRCPRTRLVRGADGSVIDQASLQSLLDFAALKLGSGSTDPGMVLFLLDADDAPACRLGPTLLANARSLRSDLDIACVLATPEYETWFVAAAESLGRFLHLGDENAAPLDPERNRLRKGWIEQRFRGIKYSETVDQPAMTKAMDLHLCRRRSPSFDKLCRELQKRLPQP
jgi:hypothetical protein